MIEIIEEAIAAHTAELTKRAETAEKHLKIAEKALIDKDNQIFTLNRVIDTRNARIKSLEETIERLLLNIDQKNADNKQLNQTIKTLNEQLAKQTSATLLARKKCTYAAVLKDLEGVLCAASDNFKELSNSIHKVLE